MLGTQSPLAQHVISGDLNRLGEPAVEQRVVQREGFWQTWGKGKGHKQRERRMQGGTRWMISRWRQSEQGRQRWGDKNDGRKLVGNEGGERQSRQVRDAAHFSNKKIQKKLHWKRQWSWRELSFKWSREVKSINGARAPRLFRAAMQDNPTILLNTGLASIHSVSSLHSKVTLQFK